MECIFCKIVNKELPSSFRYENDDFIAIDDIHPKAKIHILLISKKHIESVAKSEVGDEEMLSKLIRTAKHLAKNFGLKSYRLVINSGIDSGQEVPHLHMHILGGNRLGDIC